MTLLSIAFAIYVKQTGILLTLAFDLLLACLAVPFILGLVWRRGTMRAAIAPTRPSRPSSIVTRWSWQAGPSRSPFKPAPLLPSSR